MSKENNLTDFLTDVADAIREKKGTTEKINPQDFSEEIRGIESVSTEVEDAIVRRTITSYSNTELTEIGAYAFAGCANLTTLHFPSLTYVGKMCIFGTAITELELRQIYSLASQAFQEATHLIKVTLGASLNKHVPNMMCYGCTSFSTLILLSDSFCSLGSSAFTNTLISKGQGHIYVKDELVEEYKSATNWAAFGDMIKPLSEY
ncbi:MAG: leucine-rich repeat protein, partial [Bacteroidaceae bacterium]|nr:leucine-rich repeat protein [Bacteroidaceae bacterium]